MYPTAIDDRFVYIACHVMHSIPINSSSSLISQRLLPACLSALAALMKGGMIEVAPMKVKEEPQAAPQQKVKQKVKEEPAAPQQKVKEEPAAPQQKGGMIEAAPMPPAKRRKVHIEPKALHGSVKVETQPDDPVPDDPWFHELFERLEPRSTHYV